jgi:hypothetical protein
MLARTNILDDEQIAYFFALEEVHAAKQIIDARASGSVYFTVGLTDAIKTVLKESFGLELPSKTVKTIPMRWIKGDIVPHVDVGAAAFDTTHLLYLTDSPGQLVVDGESHPITKGSAYSFPESSRHETIHTGSEPRLLLGPMSEEGFAVGVTPTPEPESGNTYSCCDRPTFTAGPNTGYAVYTDIRVGNILIETVQRRPLSYDQLMTIRKAQCSKR